MTQPITDKMLPIPIQIFQSDDLKGAGLYLHTNRANGHISAAFLYSRNINTNSEKSVGTLYVGMPENYGLSKEGHNNIKGRFHIAVFEQRNQIAVSILDTDIEEACQLLASAIEPYDQKLK